MLQLNETEMRLLATLEEAGGETVEIALNAIAEGTGAPSELREFLNALTSLTTVDLVRLSAGRDSQLRMVDLSIDDSLKIIEGIEPRYRYNSAFRCWSDTTRTGPPFREHFPYVVLTDAGLVKSQELLRARGWEWWRSKSK